jgi:hypothetical protein
VDVEPENAPPPRRLGLVVLLVAVALMLLFARSGSRFFFLPIILPFGFGGGSLLRRISGKWRARTLLLERGALSLRTRGALSRASPAIDASTGAFVSVEPSGVSVNGVERVAVRVVGASGAFTLALAGFEHGQDLRRRLRTMMEAAGVPLVSRETPLRGAIAVRPTDDGEELSWESGRRAGLVAIVLPVLLPILVLLFLFREGPELLPILVALSGIAVAFLVFSFGRRRRKTTLSIGPRGWSILVKEATRTVAARSAPAPLFAEVVSHDVRDPFAGGMSRRETALELRSEGDVVGTLGGDLSEPELRWIEERVRRTHE